MKTNQEPLHAQDVSFIHGGEMRSHAVRDFFPKQMKYHESDELEHILRDRTLTKFPFSETLPFKKGDVMVIIPPSNIDDGNGWWKVRHSQSGKSGFIPEHCVNVTSKDEMKLLARRDFTSKRLKRRYRSELKFIVRNRTLSDFPWSETLSLKHGEEIVIVPPSIDNNRIRWCKVRALRSGKTGFIPTDCVSANEERGGYRRAAYDFNPRCIGHREIIELADILHSQRHLQLMTDARKKEFDEWSKSIDLDETCNSDDDVDPHRQAIPLKRGDTLAIIPPVNIGDSDGWWMARHLSSGRIGFIPRNRVVLEYDEEFSMTKLHDLPLELLDIILEYSLIHWMLNSSLQTGFADAIRCLASVDNCCYQRLSKPRLRKIRIPKQVKDFDKRTSRKSAVIRNNRNYLLERIDPSIELLTALMSFNLITDEQSQLVQQQRSNRDKNVKLLYFLTPLDQTKSSDFVKCLRRTKQKTVAMIIESGGVVIKVQLQNRDTGGSMGKQLLLHQTIEELQNRSISPSEHSDKLIRQLKCKGIEILNSQMNRQTVVVWIWCRAQTALQHIQSIYESNQLRELFSGITNIRQHASNVINIDSRQFKKTAVVCPITVSFTWRINEGKSKRVRGVSKLQTEIYVLYERVYPPFPSLPFVICVYEDQNPFLRQKEIEINEILEPKEVISGENENCVFIRATHSVWKMTREVDGQYKIVNWLTHDYDLTCMSLSSDGRVFLFGYSSKIVSIYGSDAKLLRSIQLPEEIYHLRHAVATSIGNVTLLYNLARRETIEVDKPKVTIEAKKTVQDEKKEQEEKQGETEVRVEEQTEMDEARKEEHRVKEKIKEEPEYQNPEKEAGEKKELEEKQAKKEEETEKHKEEEEEVREEEEESGLRGRQSSEEEKEEEKKEEEEEDVSDSGLTEWDTGMEWCISEVSSDGHIVRRFIPTNRTQKLGLPFCLALDSDDQVFVTDMSRYRVILLDCDLAWNQIIISTKEAGRAVTEEEAEDDEKLTSTLNALCYDKDNKRLIVREHNGGLNIYTLDRF